MSIYYAESIKEGREDPRLHIAAVAVFLIASLSDGLDGFIARKFNQRSKLGAALDPLADKGLLLAAILTLSIQEWHWQIPIWFAVLVVCRDIIIIVGICVLYFFNHRVEIRPHWTSKTCTFLQMVAVSWVMLNIERPSPAIPVYLAGFFTFVSGVVYVLEGIRQLKLSGHAHPEHEN